MTETSSEYHVEPKFDAEKFIEESLPRGETKRILRSDYFYYVAITTNTLLGLESYSGDDEAIDRAISITDRLIERVGEKI